MGGWQDKLYAVVAAANPLGGPVPSRAPSGEPLADPSCRVPDRAVSGDRLLVILSDIEMGPGGVVDDFPHSDVLADRLLSYNEGAYADRAVELIFNGDTFDLLKTPYNGTFPRHITSQIALAKMQPICAAHPRFFAAIEQFLDHRRAERRVHFVIGNHDAELAFPELQALVQTQCGGDPRIGFPGLSLDIGKVHIEHGSQQDRMFQVNKDALFIDYGGQPILNISWGAAALLSAVIPLREVLYFHDRVKPREVLFKLIPEIRELLVERFWSYWLRGFWKGYFDRSDRSQELTWALLKEVVWRFSFKNPNVQTSDELVRRMIASDDFLLYVVGHQHQSTWTSYGDRKVLQAGCLRNEYMLLNDGQLRAIPKCYVEVELRDELPVTSQFVEFASPPPPVGYVPASIFDAVPAVRALLASAGDRAQTGAARLDQERREADKTKPAGAQDNSKAPESAPAKGC